MQSIMYLAVSRHTMDEIPLLLTDDYGAAVKAARSVADAILKDASGAIPLMDAAAEVLGLYHTSICNVSVFTFTDGKLSGSDLIHDFT